MKKDLPERIAMQVNKFEFFGMKAAEWTLLLKEAADAIEELQKTPWISVKERLPEENVRVLGLIPLPQIGGPPALQVLWYIGDGKWQLVWNADTIRSPVTHWMPLPEPPKGE